MLAIVPAIPVRASARAHYAAADTALRSTHRTTLRDSVVTLPVDTEFIRSISPGVEGVCWPAVPSWIVPGLFGLLPSPLKISGSVEMSDGITSWASAWATRCSAAASLNFWMFAHPAMVDGACSTGRRAERPIETLEETHGPL